MHYWPYDKDWEGAGRAIGNNIHLEEMHIGMTQRTDHEMNYNTKEQFISFWTGVSNNSSMDKLTIWNYNLLGGRKFFTIMKQFIRQLTELHIERADINDKGAAALASVLSEANSLVTLTIGGGKSRDENYLPSEEDDRLLTTVGWKFIFSALKTNCGIKQVNLTTSRYHGRESFDEDTLITLSNALSHNRTLESLVLMTLPLGWESYLSKVICNESSIMATYESNHTLGYISGSKVHNKLHSLLQVNKNSSSHAAAARQKIITTHFRDANVKQFLHMDEEVYPHVIAWMAKDKDGLSLLSAFLCGISGSIGDWQKGVKEQQSSFADVKQPLDPVAEKMTSKLASIDIQDSPETKLPKRFCGRSYAEQLSIVFSESCQRRISSEVMEEQMKKIDAREAAEPEGREE